jgi:DNA primase
MKYYYSYSFPKSKLLYNLNKAKEYIKKEGKVIVVESEKSVMKLWSNGIRNCIAISGSCLSLTQVLKLEKLNVNILLAYDKDKNIEYMDKEKNKFILNAGYIYDDTNLLNVKDSPIDKGIDVFLKINKNIY